VAGLLLGPFVIGALKVPGLGFNSLEQVEGLHILTQMALGFIADTYGQECAEKTARYAEYSWNSDPANDPFAA